MTEIPEDVMKAAGLMQLKMPPGITMTEVIARAIMAERERDRWMPIETAPKDGTEILCCVSGNRYFIGVAQWAERKDWDNNSVAGWFWPYAIRPTHWQPLPPPPASKGEHHGPA